MQTHKIFPLPEEERYFKLIIFDSPIEMKNQLESSAKKGGWTAYKYAAYCGYNDGLPFKMGEIGFSKDQFWLQYIIHECLHASFWYIRQIYKGNFKELDWDWQFKWSESKRKALMTEEKMATIQTYMFTQVINIYNKYLIKTLEEEKISAKEAPEFYVINKQNNFQNTNNQLSFNL